MASLVPTISALGTTAVAAGCVAAGLTFASVSVVPAGNVGVVDMFGKVRNDVLQPGFHILNPLARLGQTHKNTNACLSHCWIHNVRCLKLTTFVVTVVCGARVHKMSTKTQLLDCKVKAPTREGLSVELSFGVLYRLNPANAVQMYANAVVCCACQPPPILPHLHFVL